MTRWTRPALYAAVALSALAIGDAVLRGSDVLPPWDPERGPSWALTAVDVVHGAAYALLAVVLVAAAAAIDGGRAPVRWLRRMLLVDLAVLAVVFLLAAAGLVGLDSEVAGIVGSVCFAAMFLLGLALGVALVRRPGLRLPAALMIAPLALVPLAVLADAVAPGWGHPGWAEAALYVGLALLGGTVDRAEASSSAAVTPDLAGREA